MIINNQRRNLKNNTGHVQ